ncbi:hypothetical protein [Streptomyces sp. NPDC091371]|uniref:hypothetical protein n=1 Tax=Streptomyces sp. NPDC091371 TaxID=3155303 RepID=UPI00341E6573
MVTARAASGAPRTRHRAGPLRLLWLAALLFGFLYTHAAGADSASAHVTGGAVTVAYAASAEGDDPGHHGERTPERDEEGSGHSHPAETCASGHPQHGVDLPCPPPAPLADASPGFAAMTAGSWARTSPSTLPALHSSLGSVVQRV